MPRYRPKGTEFEARQVTGVVEDAHALADWCDGRVTFEPLQTWFTTTDPWFEDDYEITAAVGDYIMEHWDVNMEMPTYFSCSAEDFERLYERID